MSRVAREIADAIEDKHVAGPFSERRVRNTVMQQWLLALSPPKKKRRPRDPIRGARRTTVKELDALCRKIVFARDGSKCRRCRKSEGLLDWAHVLSRRHPKTRHDLENSMVLCRKCHMYWHDRPIDAVDWYMRTVGIEAYKRLTDRCQAPGRANNALTRLYLEAEAKKLGIVP